MAKNFQKSEVKKAVEGSGGIMSTIAARLKCDWHTAKKYVDKFDLGVFVNDEREAILDMTESKLIENIQAGDTTSIIYMLNTQGRSRGYGNKQEIDHTTKGEKLTPIQISKEEIKRINDELENLV